MDRFTAQVGCVKCGTEFPVELSRMRLNYPHRCPSCGRRCNISSDQAIRAHRLLERLEYANRLAAS